MTKGLDKISIYSIIKERRRPKLLQLPYNSDDSPCQQDPIKAYSTTATAGHRSGAIWCPSWFQKGRNTRDHITNIRWIIEKAREYQKYLYICFIDYTKAFDCIEHDKLWVALRDLGVPAHLIKRIRSLYLDQEGTVRTLYGDTNWLRIGKGVTQGCILFPVLFNLYAEVSIKKLDLHSSNSGVKIGGRTFNNLRYADDTTLLTERDVDLLNLVLEIKQEGEKMGLHLNIKKTKIMTTAASGEVKFRINDEIKSVQDFIFLGSKIDRGGESAP